MKKRALTLFLVFLIVLMPVSFSLPEVYVGMNNGQVQISQNSCSFSRESMGDDCSFYDNFEGDKGEYVKDIRTDIRNRFIRSSVEDQKKNILFLKCILEKDTNSNLKIYTTNTIRDIIIQMESISIDNIIFYTDSLIYILENPQEDSETKKYAIDTLGEIADKLDEPLQYNHPIVTSILKIIEEPQDPKLIAPASFTLSIIVFRLEDKSGLGNLLIFYKYSGNSVVNFARLIELVATIGIDFTSIKNKEELGKQIAIRSNSLINNPIPNTRFPFSYPFIGPLAKSITILHDNEGRIDNKDILRTEIINNLDFPVIYWLIVYDEQYQNDILYPSTFEKLYNKIDKTNLYFDINEYEPESKVNFIMNLAKHDKIIDILDSTSDSKSIIGLFGIAIKNPKNALWFISAFDKIFYDAHFIMYKDDIEDLLMNSYNNIDSSNEDRKVFVYLIKRYIDSFSEENKQKANLIIKDSPPLPQVNVPLGFNSPITAKLYFTSTNEESELAWFYNTINFFEGFGFTKKEIMKDKEYELSRSSGTKIIVKRILKETDTRDIVDSFNDPNVQLISNRGHCYDLKACFCPPIFETKPLKLFYLGSCWSYRDANIIQPQFPEAYIVADKTSGEGKVNNLATLCIINRLEQGYSSWKDIEKSCLSANPELVDKGLVFPDHPMFVYYKFLESYPKAVG